ncbi:MAG: hypothetical protein CO093_09095 [Alphaproteobacteria bacterium CG_4_9_14_3_um_filter_47_13]|nr:MAG: hypothetical protein CO093_09095 [Alphaproteobacteria bacterium CG_4_9_14_3_um_filter_47_13]
MKWLNHMTGSYSSSAKITNNTLILSLPDAMSPVVWRMDLEEMKSAAFEIEQEDGHYILQMKTPKNDPRKIAPFENRASAMKALMAASHAMEQAQSTMASARIASHHPLSMAAAPSAKKGKTGQIIMALIGVIILGGLLFILTQTGPQKSGISSSTGISRTQTQSGESENVGVPQSADEFLRSR